MGRGRYIITFLLIAILFSAYALSFQSSSTNYDSEVIIESSGGSNTSSSNYDTTAAISQDVIGPTSSTNFNTYLGFFYSLLATLPNTAPTITTPTFNPTAPNTTSNIQCIATPNDGENTTLAVEWFWYNWTGSDYTLVLTGNTSQLTRGNSATITTLGSGNTTRWELWNCSVRTFDGEDYSILKSNIVNISNSQPTHIPPTITPPLPGHNENLTCNYNNVNDNDDDPVVNITTWYKNNKSITSLYLPFEGGSNSTYTRDYSGYSNDGNVAGASWNRYGGKIGSAYTFDSSDEITVDDDSSFVSGQATIEFWVNPESSVEKSSRTYNSVLVQKLGPNGYEIGLDSDNNLYLALEEPSVVSTGKYDNSDPASSNNGSTNGRIPAGLGLAGDRYGAYMPSIVKDGSTYKMWYSGTDLGFSERIFYATSPDGLTWTKYNNSVPPNSDTTSTDGRIPLGTSTKGDSLYIYGQSVIKDGSTYKMWYAATNGSAYRIYYATSPDGLTWTKYNNSVPPASDTTGTEGRIPLGTSGAGDSIQVWYPVVIKDGSTYKMWYTGANGTVTAVFYATSSDGLTWTKYDNTPLGPSDTTSTNGRLPLGTASSGDSYSIEQPSVIKDGSTYHMWYSASNDGTFMRIYYATSPDGLTWTKYDNSLPSDSDTTSTGGRIPVGVSGADTVYAHGPTVIKEGPVYKTWYTGNSKIFYATSTPGFNLTTLTQDSWHHIAASIDPQNINIFVDGNLVKSVSSNVTNFSNTNNLAIGSQFNGTIDEVRVYNYSLSSAQIYSDFAAENMSRNPNMLLDDETTTGEVWICAMTPNDGYVDGITLNSSQVYINNTPPTQSPPNITPVMPSYSDNLTCNWNNVTDIDNDPVHNITTWYKNNQTTLLVYTPFEGIGTSSTVKDYSGNDNDFTVSGTGAQWQSSCLIGGCFNFSNYPGQNRLAGPSLQVPQEYTISGWYKAQGSQYVANIYGGGWNSRIAIRLATGGTNPVPGILIYNSTGGSGSSVSVQVTDNVLDGSWHFIAASVSNVTKKITLYYDGVNRSTGTVNDKLFWGTTVTQVNGWSNGYGLFNGTIDEFKIYNYVVSAGQIAAEYQAGILGKNNNLLASNETSYGDEWICSVTPNDGIVDGIALNSTSVWVNNTPPTIDLISPSNGNTSIINRTPEFIWNGSDYDNDQLNYTLYVDESSDFSSPKIVNETTAEQFTSTIQLDVDTQYFWKVQATDGTSYVNSSVWNFTTLSWVDIQLTSSNVSFGSLILGQTMDTESPPPYPFVVQNKGNILTNITKVGANQSLWVQQPLGTSYFRFKADNDTTETGSFDWSLSRTSWVDMNLYGADNVTTIARLNYNDTNDEAEIDIEVTVPINEPPGTKKVTVSVTGEAS